MCSLITAIKRGLRIEAVGLLQSIFTSCYFRSCISYLNFQVLHFHAARFRWSVIFNPCYLVKFQECKNWTLGFDSYIHKAQFLIWCNYIRLVGDARFRLKFAGKVTYHPLEKRQLQQISAYNISTVRELSQSTRVTDRQPNRITTPRFTEHSLPATEGFAPDVRALCL